jgi:hypothetical protein
MEGHGWEGKAPSTNIQAPENNQTSKREDANILTATKKNLTQRRGGAKQGAKAGN